MRIILRMARKTKRKERFLDGLFFEEADSRVFICLFPVPDWANDVKCKDCGEPARFLVKNLEFMCGSCVKKYLGHSELKTRKVLSSPSMERAVNGSIFEWGLENRDRWYRIKGSNIDPTSDLVIPKEEVLRRFYEQIEQVLAGNTKDFEAEYYKTEKRLKVWI